MPLKMNGLFKIYFFLGLVCVVSSQIYSFSYEIKNSSDDLWKSSNGIVHGTKTRLNCVTDSPSTTTLRRFNHSDSLQPLTDTGHHVLFDFEELTCDDMGTYVCDDGKNRTRNLDLGILNCEPRLCIGEVHRGNIFAKVNETISLCIMAYPAVSGIEIVAQSGNGLKATSAKYFKWQTEATHTTFATYSLHITLTNIPTRGGLPRLLNIVVLHTTQPKRQTLDYTLELKYDELLDNVTTGLSKSTSPTLLRVTKKHDGSSQEMIPLVAGVCATLIVIILVLVGVIVFKKRGKRLSRKEHGEPTPVENPGIQCNEDSRLTLGTDHDSV